MKIRRSGRGFTLIEIVVAAAILALLATALVPLAVTQIQVGRAGRTQREARNVAMAFLQYYADTGRWPCNWTGAQAIDEPLEEYACLYSNTDQLRNWNGPYLNKGVKLQRRMVVAQKNDAGSYEGLLDAWGNPFRVVLRTPDPNRPGEVGGAILLLSSGPDLKLGTSVEQAVAEQPAADDIVRVVTRRVR